MVEDHDATLVAFETLFLPSADVVVTGSGEANVLVLLNVCVRSRVVSEETSFRPFELLRVASTNGLLSVCIRLVMFRVVELISTVHGVERDNIWADV